MSKFLSPLIVEDNGGFPLTLHEPLIYQSDRLASLLTVPAGAQTDLASIPRILWNVLPPIGKYDRAAVVHDFCYQTAWHDMTRATADAVLNEAMQVCGVGRFTRWIIYSGVRIGGGIVWASYRRIEAPDA